ncbi:MAG: hypothetical protein LBR68_06845 [Lachnoclostridium sp.]|jgi:hypothetical protein|nr:hypothetical protein [Lachnoclostridium sp.]
MYCRIGYLLGAKEENNNNTNILIERKNEIIEVSQSDYVGWLSVNEEKFKSLATPQIIHGLLEKDLLVEFDSENDSLKKLFDYKIVRQGVGYLQRKYSISIGGEIFKFTELQMQIWRDMTGEKSVGEIYDKGSYFERFNLSISDFIKEIMFMLDNLFAIIH